MAGRKPGKNKTPKRRRSSKVGFSLGVFLILLAFTLMGVRVYLGEQQPSDLTTTQPPEAETSAGSTQTAQKSTREDAQPGLQSGLQSDSQTTPLGQLPQAAVDVPIRPHNPRTGRLNAPTEIIVFGHLGCAACRETLRVAFNHTRSHPTSTRLISKFAMPEGADEQGIEAGLFGAIAQDEGLFWEAFAHLDKAQNPLEDKNQVLNALSAVGISLKSVRSRLAGKSALYMQQLEQDLSDFSKMNVNTLPAVILNGKLLPTKPGTDAHTQLSARLAQRR